MPPRPVGPGPAYTNTGRKQRSLDSMKRGGTVETSGSTRKRETIEGEEVSGTKDDFSFRTLYSQA